MKNSRILKMIFYFIFIIVISSCNSDDIEINQGDELLGEWRRSDASDSGNYELYFLPNNHGGECGMSYHSDGTALGYCASFYWMVTDNPKTLIVRDSSDPESSEIINSPYSFNADGQLIINNLKNGLPFNKLD